MDEITQIRNISESKVFFLETLKQDCNALQDSEQPNRIADHPQPSADARARDIMVRRIDHTIQHIRANHEGLPGTLDDLRNSLDDVD